MRGLFIILTFTGRWRKKQEEQAETSSSLRSRPDAREDVKDLERLDLAASSARQSSSSGSSSEEKDIKEENKEEKEIFSKPVTEADLNALGAKRLKAELMGNEVCNEKYIVLSIFFQKNYRRNVTCKPITDRTKPWTVCCSCSIA